MPIRLKRDARTDSFDTSQRPPPTSDRKPAWLEWAGSLTGIGGAFLVALASPTLAVAGYGLWTLSNLALIAYTVKGRMHGLLAMQAVYLVTSLLGLVNWLNVIAQR